MSATIEFGFNASPVFSGVAQLERRLTNLGNTVSGIGSRLGNDLFGGINKFVAGGALVYAGKQALDAVVGFDRLERGLTTLEGSAVTAAARMDALREAARLPGLDFEQAVRGDIRLRSVGLSAELSKKAMIEMGNALSLAGGTAADLDGVLLALTQIASKGKVSAEEINQIAERVPQVRAVMMDLFGTADTEAIQKLGISSQAFITQLIDGFSKLDRATAGLDEDLTDIASSFQMLMVDVAGPLVKELVPAFRDLVATVTDNKTEIAEFGVYAAASIRGAAEDAGRMLGVLRELGAALGLIHRAPLTVRQGGGGGGLILAPDKDKLLSAPAKQAASAAAAKPITPPAQQAAAAMPITTVDFDKIATAQLRLDQQKRDIALSEMTTAERISVLREDAKNAAAEEAALRADFIPDAEKIISAEGRKVALQVELNRLQKDYATDKEREAEASKRAAEQTAEAAVQAANAAATQRNIVVDTELEFKLLQAKAGGRQREADAIERQQRVLDLARRFESQNKLDPTAAMNMALQFAGLQDRASEREGTRGGASPSGRRKIMGYKQGQEWRGATLSAAARGGGGLGGSGGRRGFGTLADYDAMQRSPSQYDMLQRGPSQWDRLQGAHAANVNREGQPAQNGGNQADEFLEKLIAKMPPALAAALMGN